MTAHASNVNELANRLKEIAQSRKELDLGQLQIIDLGDIREAFGERWPQVRERVHETSVHFLTKRLEEEDIIVPCENGFIIVFAKLEGADAEIAGIDLANALNQFYMGAEAALGFKFRCRHERVEVQRIAAMIEELVGDGTGQIFRGHSALPFGAPISKITYKYLPVWDAQRLVVSTYITQPFDADGNYHSIRNIEGPHSTIKSIRLKRDLETIAASELALRELHRTRHPAIVGLPLHSSTLADIGHRAEILSAIDRIDEELRRYCMICLKDAGAGFPQYHLDEQVGLLSQRVNRICFFTSYAMPNFNCIENPKVWSMGYAHPALPQPATNQSIIKFRQQLERDCRIAHKAGKPIFLHLPGSAITISWAIKAGVDYIANPQIWPVVDMPDGIHRFSLSGTAQPLAAKA